MSIRFRWYCSLQVVKVEVDYSILEEHNRFCGTRSVSLVTACSGISRCVPVRIALTIGFRGSCIHDCEDLLGSRGTMFESDLGRTEGTLFSKRAL